ncbi:hypothetical protein BKA70DRAFT_1427656 [Coprinopsis sp. MPI-PUGE-AT-0042]|nr:hypothetical protein BKA70DRAFT_1427656 [Coprinopsis sp. MPI-PUGE-AT-0042]
MVLCQEVQTLDAQQEGWVIQMREERLALLPKRQSSINPSIDHCLLTAGGRIANPRTNNVQDTTSVPSHHPSVPSSTSAVAPILQPFDVGTLQLPDPDTQCCTDAGTVWRNWDPERQPPPPPCLALTL